MKPEKVVVIPHAVTVVKDKSKPISLLDKVLDEHERRRAKSEKAKPKGKRVRKFRIVKRNLTMAEAMLIGGKGRKQCIGALAESRAVCGLGMVGLGMGIPFKKMRREEVAERNIVDMFDYKDTNIATCPDCEAWKDNPGDLIPHLNDDHRWSKEKMAKWLKQFNIVSKEKVEVKEEILEEEHA